MTEPFIVLDPTLEVEAPQVERAPRPEQVRSIGLLDNGKPNSDRLLRMVVEKLAVRYPGAQVREYRKPGAYRPAPSTLLDQIAAENDIALVGIGD